jgi:hypothetical protein
MAASLVLCLIIASLIGTYSIPKRRVTPTFRWWKLQCSCKFIYLGIDLVHSLVKIEFKPLKHILIWFYLNKIGVQLMLKSYVLLWAPHVMFGNEIN